MTDMNETDCEVAGAPNLAVSVRADIDAWFVDEVLPLEAHLAQYLRRNWRDRADLDDLLQEIYLRVYQGARKGASGFTRPSSTKAFVLTAAHNLLVDLVRREKIIPMQTVDNLDALGIAAEIPGPEAQALARDELRIVQRAIDRLPPRAQQAFRLHHMEGLSVREIAARMGIAERTVVGHLNQGLQMLADILYGEVAEQVAGR